MSNIYENYNTAPYPEHEAYEKGQIYKNENGFDVKVCPQCNMEININSFNGDICNTCSDNKIVKYWEITEGDYNDVFRTTVIKGNTNQLDKYMLEQFDNDANIEDMPDFGYCIYYPEEIDPETNEPYEDQELRIEYYIEGQEIENYDPLYDGNVEIDLTNEDNNDDIKDSIIQDTSLTDQEVKEQLKKLGNE